MFYQKEKLITLEESTKLDRFKVRRMYRSFIKNSLAQQHCYSIDNAVSVFFSKVSLIIFQHFFKLLAPFQLSVMKNLLGGQSYYVVDLKIKSFYGQSKNQALFIVDGITSNKYSITKHGETFRARQKDVACRNNETVSHPLLLMENGASSSFCIATL